MEFLYCSVILWSIKMYLTAVLIFSDSDTCRRIMLVYTHCHPKEGSTFVCFLIQNNIGAKV